MTLSFCVKAKGKNRITTTSRFRLITIHLPSVSENRKMISQPISEINLSKIKSKNSISFETHLSHQSVWRITRIMKLHNFPGTFERKRVQIFSPDLCRCDVSYFPFFHNDLIFLVGHERKRALRSALNKNSSRWEIFTNLALMRRFLCLQKASSHFSYGKRLYFPFTHIKPFSNVLESRFLLLFFLGLSISEIERFHNIIREI